MTPYKVEKEFKPGVDRLVNIADGTTVTVKRLGCEAIGYDVYDPQHQKLLPLLWNNNNDGLPFEGAWKNHATLLFPIVGGLRNNRSRTLDGTEILLAGNHGFARKSMFVPVSESTDDCARITYRLTDSAETRAVYPYVFLLELTYTLKGNALSLEFQVRNTDKKPLFCQFGWHPGISTEFGLGGKRTEWQIHFPEGAYRQYHVLDTGDSFLTGKTSERRFRGPVTYSDHELHCTVMYEIDEPANRRCRFYNPRLKRGVEVVFPDLPHVGLWANANQEYICIEPWQGMDDHNQQEPFDKKVGILRLEPGETVLRSATIIPILG
ncbi:MAG: hypothetical protein V1913_03795 [Fibrobacterota bacterium]